MSCWRAGSRLRRLWLCGGMRPVALPRADAGARPAAARALPLGAKINKAYIKTFLRVFLSSPIIPRSLLHEVLYGVYARPGSPPIPLWPVAAPPPRYPRAAYRAAGARAPGGRALKRAAPPRVARVGTRT